MLVRSFNESAATMTSSKSHLPPIATQAVDVQAYIFDRTMGLSRVYKPEEVIDVSPSVPVELKLGAHDFFGNAATGTALVPLYVVAQAGSEPPQTISLFGV